MKAEEYLKLERRTGYLRCRVPRKSHKFYMPVCKELPEVQLQYRDKALSGGRRTLVVHLEMTGSLVRTGVPWAEACEQACQQQHRLLCQPQTSEQGCRPCLHHQAGRLEVDV